MQKAEGSEPASQVAISPRALALLPICINARRTLSVASVQWPMGNRSAGWCQTNGRLWQGSDLLCTVISLASLASKWKPINQAVMPLHWFWPEESAQKRWISFVYRREHRFHGVRWHGYGYGYGQNRTLSGWQEHESRNECSEVTAHPAEEGAGLAGARTLWLHRTSLGHVVLALQLFIRIPVKWSSWKGHLWFVGLERKGIKISYNKLYSKLFCKL